MNPPTKPHELLNSIPRQLWIRVSILLCQLCTKFLHCIHNSNIKLWVVNPQITLRIDNRNSIEGKNSLRLEISNNHIHDISCIITFIIRYLATKHIQQIQIHRQNENIKHILKRTEKKNRFPNHMPLLP